jgi:F-type H+-transporting ATPase subunit a
MNHVMHQFEVKRFVPLELFGFDVSFTNASLFMVLAFICGISLLWFLVRKQEVVPGISQAVIEGLYRFIKNTAADAIGHGYEKYLPYIFSVFIFVLMGNLLGLFPYSFTFTSQLAPVGAFALLGLLVSAIIGLKHQGLKWFRTFLPTGVPVILAPIIVPIEIISFLSKPFSLTIRLVMNMFVGHILLKIVAGYVYSSGLFGTVPVGVICILIMFELFVAFLQAYIFTILTKWQ